MSDFFNVILDFIGQFTGGRGGIDHNVVQFVLAAILWGTLLVYALDRRKEEGTDRERLLVYGFAFGLGRELFMLGMAFLLALGWVEHPLLHSIFPPLEHTLQYTALLIVAGGFLQFLLGNLKLACRYVRYSLLSLGLCYLATFWWWGEYILGNPTSKFGQTWCDWVFHIHTSIWLLIALWLTTGVPKDKNRSLIRIAMTVLSLSVFLKIPDMVLGEVYELTFAPLSHASYLLGILLLAILYLREQGEERKTAKQQIVKLAYYDKLTQLPNRTLFYDRLHQTLALADRSHARFAILFIDLDHFKEVNDTYGHACGDRLLKAVGSRLKNCLRMGDTLARLGGDEFVILLPNIDSTTAAVTVVDKVMLQLEEQFQIENLPLYSSACIGLAFYPENGQDTETLIKNADIAMYAAKNEGQGRYHLFSAEMHNKIVQRHKIAEELRIAIHEEDFELHYQPQIDVDNEKIIGAEALVRWRHPQKGFIPPDQFISVAEETGLIQPLGEWIFRTACKQLKCWLDQGLTDFKLAINISAYRLEQSDFLRKVEAILEEYSLNPQLLELELTESTMLSDMDKASSLLKQLKLRGFSLAMDDFGTGYSSLSYLKDLPFDQVKIDQSFIREIHTNDDSAMLVKTILAMAQHLKLSVVAEGVETYEQLAYLKRLGCERAQGFYFSRPLPADDFAESLFSSQFNSDITSA